MEGVSAINGETHWWVGAQWRGRAVKGSSVLNRDHDGGGEKGIRDRQQETGIDDGQWATAKGDKRQQWAMGNGRQRLATGNR